MIQLICHKNKMEHTCQRGLQYAHPRRHAHNLVVELRSGCVAAGSRCSRRGCRRLNQLEFPARPPTSSDPRAGHVSAQGIWQSATAGRAEERQRVGLRALLRTLSSLIGIPPGRRRLFHLTCASGKERLLVLPWPEMTTAIMSYKA